MRSAMVTSRGSAVRGGARECGAGEGLAEWRGGGGRGTPRTRSRAPVHCSFSIIV